MQHFARPADSEALAQPQPQPRGLTDLSVRAQEEQQSTQQRLADAEAKLERAAAHRSGAKELLQDLHRRCADAASQCLAAREAVAAAAFRAPAQSDQRTAPSITTSWPSLPQALPTPGQSQGQMMRQQSSLGSVFSCATWSKLPNPDAMPVSMPLSFGAVVEHAARIDMSMRNAMDNVVFELDAHVRSYQAAVLERVGCRADKVAWWIQLHADAAPGKPLSFSSTCGTPECAASMCMFYNLSIAEAMVLTVAERCLEEACAACGARRARAVTCRFGHAKICEFR
jgi:hypothetical protein